MSDTLHSLQSAAVAIRRLNQSCISDADANTLARLSTLIDKYGEAIARTIRIVDFVEKAASAESEAEQAHATGGAIASFVALAKLTGVSQIAKYEAVTRASDALGVETPDAFLHKPGSSEDKEECRDLASGPDGRAFTQEVLAHHLDLFPIGVAAHEVIRAQIASLNLAAQGRSIWPKPVPRERIKTNSGRQHTWEVFLAYRGGMTKQMAEHHGVKLSDEGALHMALVNFVEEFGTEPPAYVSIPSLLQTLQKERGLLPKAFRYGKRRMAVILRTNPMVPDDLRQEIEKIR